MALNENTTFAEPLPNAETMKAVASAWGYHAERPELVRAWWPRRLRCR